MEKMMELMWPESEYTESFLTEMEDLLSGQCLDHPKGSLIWYDFSWHPDAVWCYSWAVSVLGKDRQWMLAHFAAARLHGLVDHHGLEGLHQRAIERALPFLEGIVRNEYFFADDAMTNDVCKKDVQYVYRLLTNKNTCIQQMKRCWVCNSPYESGLAVCPECGVNLDF
jgi:hypothetical protein